MLFKNNFVPINSPKMKGKNHWMSTNPHSRSKQEKPNIYLKIEFIVKNLPIKVTPLGNSTKYLRKKYF